MTDSGKLHVVGIGGIFFRGKSPKKLSQWYTKHLGLKIQNNVALFTWRPRKSSKRVGYTVWSIFPRNSRYFGSKNVQFMINYRVKDLDGLLAQLRRNRVPLVRKVEKSEYGKFAWITDPDGHTVELWEPPRSYRPPEEEIPSE